MAVFQDLVGSRFVDDRLYQQIQLRAFGLVGRGVIPDPFIMHHFIYLLLVLRGGVVHADGMPAVRVDKLHAGDIRIAVPDIYHIPERDTDLLR